MCAVDIDDSSGSAFGQALAIARTRSARLLLVCAVPPGQPFNQRAPERVARLLKLRREAEAAGVDVRVDVQTGESVEILLLHGASRRADLMVVGVEHDRANGRPWGAVAEAVLRSAPCSTLVVPAGAAVRPSFSRILCTVDAPSDAGAAAAGATSLADARDAALTVFHVAGDRGGEAAILQRLQAVIPHRTGTPAAAHVAAGAVVPEILKAARTLGADLLVIGARPRSFVTRRLFGVTRAILAGASCPVLAVPMDRMRAGVHRPAA